MAEVSDERLRRRKSLPEVFWREYRAIFEILQADLAAQTRDAAWAHDYTVQFLNRCLFLCFLQRQRWLGDDPDCLRAFWEAYTGVRQENDLDRRHEFRLPDARVLQVLAFLERYLSTVGADTPLRQQAAGDAEMLGCVYEDLVNRFEAGDARDDAGIVYTPGTEIDLMCRLSLVDHLANHLGAGHKGLFYETLFAGGPDAERAADDRLARENLWTAVDTLLREVTVIDPACGSGSFLVGMLQVVDNLVERANRALGRQETPYERRRRIIGQSLHGVDVMPGAVEAAKLRLWLQLLTDAEPPSAAPNSRPLLPDLSCHLRCGDSLMQEWDRRFDIVIGNPPYVRHEGIRDLCRSRAEVSAGDKRQYKAQLAAAVYRAYPSFFGSAAGRGCVSRKLSAQSDLYVYFFFRCLSLLKEKGTFCFLTSNSWLDVAYGAILQEFLLRQCHIKMILDNQTRRSFASADVNTVITLLSGPGPCPDWGPGRTVRFVTLQVPFERALSPLIFPQIEAASARQAAPEYRVFPIRQDHLLHDGETPENGNVHVPGAEVGRSSSGPLCRPARYAGGKWGGKFLRAPEVFHRIREIAGHRLVPLGRLGKVRYPIKTGINGFFYLDENRIAAFDIDRRFLVRVVKSPREFRSIRLHEDDVSRFLFTCPLSLADLAACGCSGTLAYIQWGARQETVPRQKSPGGVPWPQAPSVRGRPQWYSIDPLAPADVICNRFFHDRFFFGFADFPIVEDQTFYGCTFTIPEACRRAQMAVLNSTLQFLLVELLGRIALGEGVLQYATYEMAQMLTLDARQFTERQRDEISRAFAPLADRPLTRVEQEVALCDRRALDDCVFDVLGLTRREREAVYEAVVSLVDARLRKAESLLPQRRRSRAAGPPAL